jgi:hypothetical protein
MVFSGGALNLKLLGGSSTELGGKRALAPTVKRAVMSAGIGSSLVLIRDNTPQECASLARARAASGPRAHRTPARPSTYPSSMKLSLSFSRGALDPSLSLLPSRV